MAVVRAIAEVEGVDPADVERPLYDRIDPDALDALLSPSSAAEVGVDFRAGDYLVRVDEGSVTVRGAAGSATR